MWKTGWPRVWFGETTTLGAQDTVEACHRFGKPCLPIFPGASFEPSQVAAWILENKAKTLKVACNRETVEPRIGDRVERQRRAGALTDSSPSRGAWPSGVELTYNVFIENLESFGDSEMSELTVPVSGTTHKVLLDLAAREGNPVQTVLDKAVEAYRRQQFLAAVNEGYSALRRDSAGWQDELEERRAWDSTLADDLGDEA